MNIELNLIRQASRQSFVTFAERAMHVMIPGYVHFPYISLVAAHIEKPILSSQPGRIAINVPPRHGKTFVLVTAAAWFLGRHPDREVLLMVHSQSLAADIAGKLNLLLNSKLFKETFPAFELQQGREGMSDFRTEQGGGFKAASFDQGVTGRGAHLLLLDDTLSAHDAYREGAREAVRQVYDTMLSTRINDPNTGIIISMAHRLHEEDLTAHLVKQGFEHLKLPFVAATDELYEIGGVSFARAIGQILQPGRLTLESTKMDLTPHVFATQYQQAPTAVGAGILKRQHFPMIPLIPAGGFTVISWDIAASQRNGSSYSVGLVFQVFPEAAYLKQIIRERFEYTKLRERALSIHSALKPIHLIENTSLGVALLSDLRKVHANVIDIKVGSWSKEQRLNAVMDQIENAFVRPLEKIPLLEEFLDELTSFPYGTHDDCVDALTQFLSWNRDYQPVRKHPPVVLGAGKLSRTPYRNGFYPRTERRPPGR